MTSVHERVAAARQALVDAGISSTGAGLDAEVLARHVLGWDRAALLSRGREPAPDEFASRYAALVARRVAREPVAMIVGSREFWGLDFEVTRDVLIPRPETEFVVEEVLDLAGRGAQMARIADIGTGSGCVAIAIATELPDADVLATDVSAAALEVARRNAERNGVAGRIRFVRADLLTGVQRGLDLIVSNPPYVPRRSAPSLQPEVGGYEPSQALFGGDDGLEILHRLLATAGAHLSPDGRLITEFGDGQEADVRRIAESLGWHVLNVRNDLQGLARVALLRR